MSDFVAEVGDGKSEAAASGLEEVCFAAPFGGGGFQAAVQTPATLTQHKERPSVVA